MPFRKVQWLFPIAVGLHNSEEALSMPQWVRAHGSQIPAHPGAATIWTGLLLLTFLAFAVTSRSTKSGPQSVWTYLFFGYVVAMLANVVVPHVPASIAFRGYTPGVVTAVLINLPLMSIVLVKALREDWVSGTKAVAYGVLVPLTLLGAIATLFAVTS